MAIAFGSSVKGSRLKLELTQNIDDYITTGSITNINSPVVTLTQKSSTVSNSNSRSSSISSNYSNSDPQDIEVDGNQEEEVEASYDELPDKSFRGFSIASLAPDSKKTVDKGKGKGKQSTLLKGDIISSLYHLQKRSCFVFPGLRILKVGTFRLKFDLYEILRDGTRFIASVYSNVFRVSQSKLSIANLSNPRSVPMESNLSSQSFPLQHTKANFPSVLNPLIQISPSSIPFAPLPVPNTSNKTNTVVRSTNKRSWDESSQIPGASSGYSFPDPPPLAPPSLPSHCHNSSLPINDRYRTSLPSFYYHPQQVFAPNSRSSVSRSFSHPSPFSSAYQSNRSTSSYQYHNNSTTRSNSLPAPQLFPQHFVPLAFLPPPTSSLQTQTNPSLNTSRSNDVTYYSDQYSRRRYTESEEGEGEEEEEGEEIQNDQFQAKRLRIVESSLRDSHPSSSTIATNNIITTTVEEKRVEGGGGKGDLKFLLTRADENLHDRADEIFFF